ncbi:MAG: transcriptional repressor LexA [Actinomycetota bacterium]|nr:transcriptional repressor LexA [Actinomycetota bacterium]
MDLTERQNQILNYILNEVAAKGFPPSVREICEATGLSSTSTVHSHLKSLEKMGFIRRDATKPRTIEVLDQTRHDALGQVGPARALPLVGRVAAGLPIFAEENIEEMMVLPKNFASDDSFIIEVKGESMIEAAILDGDYLVVRKQRDADDGDIVVALMDGEATVKRLFKKLGHIELRPENRSMKPIITREVEIVGKVISLLRRV